MRNVLNVLVCLIEQGIEEVHFTIHQACGFLLLFEMSLHGLPVAQLASSRYCGAFYGKFTCIAEWSLREVTTDVVRIESLLTFTKDSLRFLLFINKLEKFLIVA